MSDTRPPRIDLERAKRGPTAEDLAAIPATTAADWVDAAVVLPVDRDIFEEAGAKQRARAVQAAKKPGKQKRDYNSPARKKARR
ncbi:MAG: hypothetical protein HYR63_11885 [Proteobacteria bacterium]|nr:hypothetical protein [Pseudomonadota bacterium]MBI3498537.1 hypothetical protein [Pseudomonadota bacterium]